MSLEINNTVSAPPLGLKPEFIHHKDRAIEITEAMQRYVRAEKSIPQAWFDELHALFVES